MALFEHAASFKVKVESLFDKRQLHFFSPFFIYLFKKEYRTKYHSIVTSRTCGIIILWVFDVITSLTPSASCSLIQSRNKKPFLSWLMAGRSEKQANNLQTSCRRDDVKALQPAMTAQSLHRGLTCAVSTLQWASVGYLFIYLSKILCHELIRPSPQRRGRQMHHSRHDSAVALVAASTLSIKSLLELRLDLCGKARSKGNGWLSAIKRCEATLTASAV